MKSNYDILGNHIRLIDTRNRESITDRVLGINIDKFFCLLYTSDAADD